MNLRIRRMKVRSAKIALARISEGKLREHSGSAECTNPT